MSSTSPTTSSGQWPLRPSKRSKLRNGTFIIPSTGERSRRQFTLRSAIARSAQPDADDGSEMRPFFSRASMMERVEVVKHNTFAVGLRFWKFLNSPTGHGVLKCTLAYTLASFWTFWSPLSDFLGRPDGKHVVATITVYFHPSRTAGSQIEAILIATLAVAYAELVSILSMAVSVLFGSVFGFVALAHATVVIVFIGGGFGIIGWVKQRLNNPLVNVGSTLASLAIIGVVTRENAVHSHVFSDQKIIQVFKMLICGIATTSLVNLLVWRVSARSLLRMSMTKASTSLGDMLSMIAHGFLSGSEEELLSEDFLGASSTYAAGHPLMTKNLREAKFEHYFLGNEEVYALERAVVRSIEALAQSIGGLRSAANTQFALLKESYGDVPSGSMSPGGSTFPPNFARSISGILKSGNQRNGVLSAIEEASEESTDVESGTNQNGPSRRPPLLTQPSFRTPSDIFELFIAIQGPSMKSLAYTLSEILRVNPFGVAPDYEITINDHFRHSLTEALSLFNSARANALQELYKTIGLGRAKSEKIKADFEEVAAACGHFSFSLQTFGEEMQKYLDVLDDLKYATEHKNHSWRWMRFWSKTKPRSQTSLLPYDVAEREPTIKPIKKTALPKGIPDAMIEQRDKYNWQAAPGGSKLVAWFSQSLLKMIRKLARDDIRFGLKVGMGAALWAMFAFIPETRDTYNHWRGEWGLLSFMIVCSMTMGAANTTGWTRFIATLIGASTAFVDWNISQGNAVVLCFLGSLLAFVSFYVFISLGKAPLGRTILLAYNVSALYAYSLSQKVDDDDDDEGGVNPNIGEIAMHRAVAVTVGIVWGLIVCRVIWPISARRKFKEGLSMLYLQMGLIWKRGPLAILLRSDATRSYLRSGEQAALQKYAARLDSLRVSAASEFELRGPFPNVAAGRIMRSTDRILDAFYAMSLVTQRRGTLTDGERALLMFTAQERAQLCDRICHVFQVLASSTMLEHPLTDAVPSVAGSRDRLLGKIFRFREEHSHESAEAGRGPAATSSIPLESEASGLSSSTADTSGTERTGSTIKGSMERNALATTSAALAGVEVQERDYALLYAYALVTGQVAEELKIVEKEIEGMYGVLNEDILLLE